MASTPTPRIRGALTSPPLRLFPLAVLLAVAVAVSGLPTTDTVHAQSPPSQSVPADWEYVPEGAGPGDSFRLLFVTSATRNAASADIADYNAHARSAANANGSLKPFGGGFTALISTAAVDARDNTATTGTGVPVYWLGGEKVADDYADLYDKSWDSVSGRTETGSAYSGLVWTGGNKAGAKSGQRHAGAEEVRLGDLGDATLPLSSPAAGASGESYPLYALSPVLTVAEPEPEPTPTPTTTPTPTPAPAPEPEPARQEQRQPATPAVTAGPVIVSSPGSGDTYRRGEAIVVAVTFSEAVTVSGDVRVRIDVAGRKRWARYNHSEQDGTVLVFAYKVKKADADGDGVSLKKNAVDLNGGRIADADGNAAKLKHPALADQSGHKVDGSRKAAPVQGQQQPQQRQQPQQQQASNRPPTFSSGTASRSIVENGSQGRAVGDPVTATDPDGDSLSYSLTGNNAPFRIESGTGQITVNGTLNKATTPSYTVTVTARDPSGLTATATVTISVTVAAGRTVTFASGTDSRSVAENQAAGTSVGSAITATASGGVTVSYEILDSSASFAINSSTGQITTRESLDHEARSSYTVIVIASATSGLKGAASKEVTINVTDADEAGTLGLAGGAVTVGQRVGAGFRDYDAGVTGVSWLWQRSTDRSSWTQVRQSSSGGHFDGYRPVAADVGNYLRVTVTYSDTHGSGKSLTKTTASTVQARTEKPSSQKTISFAPGNVLLSVAENQNNAALSPAVTATHSDGSSVTITYSLPRVEISGLAANSQAIVNKFGINSATGVISVKGTLDYEERREYILLVQASGGGLTAYRSVAVRVTNVDEPGYIVIDGGCTQSVRVGSGKSITATLIDPDGAGSVTWAWKVTGSDQAAGVAGKGLTGRPPGNAFRYTYLPSEKDVEDDSGMTVSGTRKLFGSVTYKDDAGGATVRTIDSLNKCASAVGGSVGAGSITVQSGKPAFSATSLSRSVAENSAGKTLVGAPVTATDPNGKTLRYWLDLTFANLLKQPFSIDSRTGQIRVRDVLNPNLDYETKNSYSVPVKATNSDGLTAPTVTVTITITDVTE